MKFDVWSFLIFSFLAACHESPTPQEEIRDQLFVAARGCSHAIYSNANIRPQIERIIDQHWESVEDYIYAVAATSSPIPSLSLTDGYVFHAVLRRGGYSLQITTPSFSAVLDEGRYTLIDEYDLRSEEWDAGSFTINLPTNPMPDRYTVGKLLRCSFGDTLVERRTIDEYEGSGVFTYLVSVNASVKGRGFAYEDASSGINDSRLCKQSECLPATDDMAADIRNYFLNFPSEKARSALIGFNVKLYYLLNEITAREVIRASRH